MGQQREGPPAAPTGPRRFQGIAAAFPSQPPRPVPKTIAPRFSTTAALPESAPLAALAAAFWHPTRGNGPNDLLARTGRLDVSNPLGGAVLLPLVLADRFGQSAQDPRHSVCPTERRDELLVED